MLRENRKIYLVVGIVIFLVGFGIIRFLVLKVPETVPKECTKFPIDSYEIFKKEPLADSSNFIILYYNKEEDKDSVLYGRSYRMAIIDSSGCILDHLYPRPEIKDWLLTGYQWLRAGDFNNDGITEVAYLGYAMGTGHYNEFVLFQQQDNGKFIPLFYWDNGENSVEIRDINLDGKEEIIHYYRILGYKPHLYWRDVFEWNNMNQRYERQNDLIFYGDLIEEYLEFIESYNNSEEYKYLVEAAKCLMRKAQLSEPGDDCLVFSKLESITELSDGQLFVSTVKISSVEQLEPAELSCATPNSQQIKGEFKLYLMDKNYTILDEISLTDPTIILKEPLEKYEFTIKDEKVKNFYRPWDIDGDGRSEEFVIVEYQGCNGNNWSFIKYDKENKKLKNILFERKDGSIAEEIYVGHGKDNLKVADGNIEYTYYGNLTGKWFRNLYKYDKAEDKFKWQSTNIR